MANNRNISEDAENLALIRKLAHNEKHERDKAIEMLNALLCGRCADEDDDQDKDQLKLDFLKLWKGLFYGMWMSDKVRIQRELALVLSELVHCFRKPTLFITWCECFFLTLQREWYRMDKYRIDKYYTLIRFYIRNIFAYMMKNQWEKDTVAKFTCMLKADVIDQRKALGLKFHVSDLYLEELCKVAGGSLENEIFLQLLEPFLFEFANSTDSAWQRRLKQSVLDKIIDDFHFNEYYNQNEEKSEDGDTIFSNVSLVILADLLWTLASNEETSRQSCRPAIYTYHKRIKKKIKNYGVGYTVTMPIKTTNAISSQWTEPVDPKQGKTDEKELKKRKREEQSKETDSTHEGTNFDDNGETDGHDAREQVNSMPSEGVQDSTATDKSSKSKKRKKRRKKSKGKGASDSVDKDTAADHNQIQKKASHSRRVSFSPTNRQKNYKNSVRDLRKKKRIGKSKNRSATSAGILRVSKRNA